MAAFDAAGDPDALPGTRRAVAAHASSTTTPLSTGHATKAEHEEMVRRGLESPYCGVDGDLGGTGARQLEITTRVACGDYFEVRDQALIAHATQIDPHGLLVRCPTEVSARRGRPRTTIWRGHWLTPNSQRTTCSPEFRRRSPVILPRCLPRGVSERVQITPGVLAFIVVAAWA